MACLDTSFLIDLLRGREDARETMEELDAEGSRHAVAPVSAAELWVGAHRGSAMELERAGELLDSLLWLEATRACARRAGRIQATLLEEGEPIGFTDCTIAAVAIEHGHALVTRDGDFERVPDLAVRRY
jgi:tRNA(fMet)-specific endonuclease VapC